MKLNELLEEATQEFEQEKKEMAKEEIRERLREIHMAKLTLKKMEKGLTRLLDQDVDDIEL